MTTTTPISTATTSTITIIEHRTFKTIKKKAHCDSCCCLKKRNEQQPTTTTSIEQQQQQQQH